jgi:FkbM family methyltransferase
MNASLTRFLKHWAPRPLIRALLPLALRRQAVRLGLSLSAGPGIWDLHRGGDTLRLSQDHAAYLAVAMESFDFFFNAVKPVDVPGGRLVDCSVPRDHSVAGFDAFPIRFPALAEPLGPTLQYLDFAGLGPGMVALDLGAYAGLTSILFSQAVGASGLVVAVEADPLSLDSLKTNLARFAQTCPNPVTVLEGAVWEHNQGIVFSSEGNLGAGAASLVGSKRGRAARTPSFTLGAIADRAGLDRVDFIKCDVEGAETVVFKDRDFFRRFSPRIMVETHVLDGRDTQAACAADLGALGYRCEAVDQHGFPLPLLQCTRGRA